GGTVMEHAAWILQGLQLRNRLGGPEGDVLVERTTNPLVTSCRALMARGITGPFETWKPGIDYPLMRGDIQAPGALSIKKDADPKGATHPTFRMWEPYNAPSARRSSLALRPRQKVGGGPLSHWIRPGSLPFALLPNANALGPAPNDYVSAAILSDSVH